MNCRTRSQKSEVRSQHSLLTAALCFLAAALCSLNSTFAAQTVVHTPAELTAALAAPAPGDTIILHDGTWTDLDLLFAGNGTAAQPITLRAETLGGVKITGQSRLRLAGNYLVVDGLTFTDGYPAGDDAISFRDTSDSPANHSRLINCAIVDYNPPSSSTDTKWVSMYGLSNRVEYCYFRGKTNAGGTLIVWMETHSDAPPNYHVISRNYFGQRPALGVNGGETIRIGTSDWSFNTSRTTVEHNLFERCSGDAEIISSKSCENIFRHNTFIESEGTLSLRHGNRSVVEANYFFGNRKLNTGGVRVVGEDHKIFNNYFYELFGTASRAPLSIMQGLDEAIVGSPLPLNGYFPVKNAIIVHNTFAYCTNSLIIGLVGTYTGTSFTTTVPPTNCVIANNLVSQPAGKIVDPRTNGLNFIWESNILFGPTLGITANGGMLRVDPQLVFNSGPNGVDTLLRPSSTSPALSNAVGTYEFVTQDFDGQTRTALKDIGADQASTVPILYPPLTTASVGPLWMRTNGTFLTWPAPAPITYGTPLSAAQLNASANAAGILNYDPPVDTVLSAGSNQILTVVFTPFDAVNFAAATQTVTIHVLQAPPVVTWTNPAAITYGTALSAIQLNATVNIPGTFTYAPAPGTILNASNGQTLSVQFTPTDVANFLPATRTVTVNVGKKTPSISWIAPPTIEQGTALSAAQYNVNADAPGTFTYNPPLGTVLSAGSGQILSLNFTPNNTANFLPVSRTAAINVTIGGKTLPIITWPAPWPILFGTPLSGLQLNAATAVPGTLTYTPSVGTVLPAGNGQVLSVTFTPFDSVTYTPAVKTVSIDVAHATSNAILRVAYLVPANRVAQNHAAATLRRVVLQYQQFFAGQMQVNGFGPKTFTFETEPDGITPLIHVLTVPATDSYLRGDIYGNRVLDVARNAGLTIGAPGQVWWLIPETHIEYPEGAIGGGFAVGHRTNAIPVDSGWAISSSHELALYQMMYQTNALLYDGTVVPDIGPHALVQDISFPWFEGITLSGVSSSAVGAGLRNLGEAFGLSHDFRNDENFNGNLMGFGFRGIRGVFYPDLYLYNYCTLSYASAMTLSVSPFFNPNRVATDLTVPALSVTTSGTRNIVNGVLSISFNASDDQSLHAAVLTWESSSDFIVVDEMPLTGTNVNATFQVPYFNSLQTNRYVVTVFDRQGNRRSAQTSIYPNATVNHAAQPFIRVSPVVVGPGEDVLLDASDSFDPEHVFGLLEVEWDLNADGEFDTLPSADLVLTTNFLSLGRQLIRARLTDPSGDSVLSTPIAVDVRPCTTSLSPVQRSSGYGGGNNKVTVTTTGKCRWTPVPNDSWIHIVNGNLPAGSRSSTGPDFVCFFENNGSGSTEVGPIVAGPEFAGAVILNYFVDPNPLFIERRGTISIGDQTYTIIQQPQVCTYSISPTNRFHGRGTNSGTIKVTTKDGCEWAALNTNSWIMIISGGAGPGSNMLTYVMGANTAPTSRTGYITIEEKVFAVTQWGTECQLALSPSARVHTNSAEIATNTISTSSGCEWTIQNTNDWITSVTPVSGNTSSNFSYAVAPNLANSTRVGVIWVNNEAFTVFQQGCSVAIDPLQRGHFYTAQTGSVCVAAGNVCAWSVSNTNDWISFLQSGGGVGNGRLDYVVAANPTSNPRAGTFSIEGIDFTVTQDGKPCLYDIDPPEAFYGEEGTGFAEIFVFAEPGCAWDVQSPVPWVTVLLGQGDGQGSVYYVVEPNNGPARSTTLEIAGQYHEISQASGVREITISDMTIATGETNHLYIKIDAHGGEAAHVFSLCHDPDLLTFTGATLSPTAPNGASIIVSGITPSAVGLMLTMPAGFAMPPGTGAVIKVSYRAASINGKRNTTITFCDNPEPRQLVNPLGQPLAANYGTNTVRIIGFCSLAESLDIPESTWTVSPIPWVCVTNVTHDLEDAAVSSSTPEGGESYMETTLTGPGILSFWWKVSSEPSNDRLRFYIDDTTQFTISGEMPDWEWRTITIASGTHRARWRYTKNSNGITGIEDRGWVDQVVFAPLPPSITGQPASQVVDAGSTATFNVSAVGQPPLTYQWLSNQVPLIDGINLSGAQTTTLRLTNVQPAQAAAYSVIVTTPEGGLQSANAILSVTPLLPLPEALDATNFTWTTSGNGTWVGQSATNHDGMDAARSGNITNNQTTVFQATLTGPGTVSFWWKVSSQTNGDFLTFTNGSQGTRISGETDWQEKAFVIGAGSQTLRWSYIKNGSTSQGQDRGWVDEVRFIPAAVTITAHPTNQLVDEGSSATLAVGVSGTPPVSYQWLLNGENIAGANAATLVLPNVQLADAGQYSVIVSNVAGGAASTNAWLQVNQLVPLPEALDATNLVWTTNGTPPWVGQTVISQDGSDAARSGRIDHSGTTLFRTTVTGPGTVSFWWKVSSEPSNDRLRFYMGPSSGSLSEQQNISGQVDWTWRTWSVASGSQILEWRYTKNSSIVSNLDCAWVDQIHYVPNSTPTAPFMAIQPTNRTIVSPTNVVFNAVAGGSATLAYQWLFNGAPLANGLGVGGATTTNLTLTNATSARAGDYSVLVSNAAGTVVSAVAHLTVITAPVITAQPVSQNVLAGTTVNFSVGALGQAPLSYYWMFNGAPLANQSGKVSGATTPTVTLTGVQSAQEGTYSVLVSNAAGTALSSQSGVLSTWDAARSAAITNGESTTLSTTVTGPGTIRFSWKVSSQTNSDFFAFLLSGQQPVAISGEIDWRTETFSVPGGIHLLEWRYSKDATSSAGLDAGFLDAVEFTPDGVSTIPVIVQQPLGRTVLAGATITLEAAVSGSSPLGYQWRFNDLPLANGTGVIGTKTPRLTLVNAQPARSGSYSLFASNSAGFVTSLVATVTITSAPLVTVGAPVVTTPPLSQNVSENATVGFSVVAAGTAPLTYRWQLNGTNLADGNGLSGTTTSTLSLSNVSPSQIGNYTVLVSNAVGVVVSPAASLSVLTLSEAAGTPYLNLLRAGDASWVAQTNMTFDGVNAVRTGTIGDGQNTRLETWVDGPGVISFRWKVSSEPVNDNLRFYIGATEMVRISGEVSAWQQQSYNVPEGTQILLKWRYGKDTTANSAGGQDAGWVDDVQYTFTGSAVVPFVTNQPMSETTSAGGTVSFNVGAGGTSPMTYQWRLNGANLTNGASVKGAKTPRLTLVGVQPAQGGDYSLLISNSAGTVSSSVASLSVTTILAAPIISTHPVSQAVNQGVNVSFSAAATGAAPLSYRWQFNGTDLFNDGNISGAATPVLTLNNVQPNQIGNYTLVASNAAGVAASTAASLTLLALNEIVGAPYLNFLANGNTSWTAHAGQTYVTTSTNGGAVLTVSIPPSITSQPSSRTVSAGNDVSFNVGIGGTPPLSTQWRLNGVPLSDGDGISGTTTTTLLLTEVQAANAGNYSAVISNAVGIATSANAVLTVITPPTIITDPQNLLVAEGLPATFNVVASGTGPLSYRWRRNGTNLVPNANLTGITAPVLTLNSAQPSQAGLYSVEVSNAAGVAVSDPAQLLVNAAMTMGEAINAPYLEWNTDPSAPWTVQTNITHDGDATAQSGNITHDESTFIESLVTGPGTIRFWWKVSSQTNADTLTFFVNGSQWAQISGVVDWQQLVFNVPAGQVTLRWTYSKDASGTAGLDHGWLDEVDFAPTTGPSVPVIILEPLGQDVDPGADVVLSIQALGTAPLSYQWRFEGQDLSDGGNVFGARSPTLSLLNIQVAQAGAYDVVVRNPYSLDVSEQVFVNVIPVISLPTALDTTNLTWVAQGYSAWRGQTNINFDRIDSAQSGALPNNQTNWIQTIVNGPGAINFWWKSSSQTNSDRLRFAINGVEMANISGETDWRQRTFTVENPNTQLRWSYTKDGTNSAGLDRGWVDQVIFGPSAPIITNTSQDITIVDQGTTIRLNIDAAGTKPFSYQWKWNGVSLMNSDTNLPLFPGFITGAVGNHRLTISNAQPYQSGTYVGEVYNEAGVAISPPFTVQVIPALPLDIALNSNLVWETEGASLWVGTTNVTHDGFMAARNGTLDNARSALLRTTVTGPGTLKFWWKASTETNADILTFSINGIEQAAISGNHNWQQKTYDLDSGTFVFAWEYNKNALGTNNLDQVFVDEVFWGPVPPVITNQPLSQVADQGATVTITAGVKGTPPLIYEWTLNGVPLINVGNITGTNTSTLRITGAQPSQSGVYALQVSNAAGFAISAPATLTVLPTYSLAEALDNTNFVWTTGSPGWIGQGSTTYDNQDAARSPAIGHSASATMQATITGPGTITFVWKVSSQAGDELSFYTNNTKIVGISGDVPWQSRTFTLAPGNQIVKWTYAKNSSGTNGEDRGWVDQVVFAPTPPSIVTQPVGVNVDQGGTAIFSVATAGTPPFTYQWQLNSPEFGLIELENCCGITGTRMATLTITDVQPDYAGQYSVIVRNAGGEITSANVSLAVTMTVPLAQALDGTNLTWTTSGSPLWVGQTGVSQDGADAARIQAVPSSGSASMQTTITGPGTISFWWKVSSETNSDRLTFYTNNTAVTNISGEVDWKLRSINVGPGSQTLKWTYSKNGSVNGGQDRAWVDQVLFGPVAPTIATQPLDQNIDEGGMAKFSVVVAGTPPFQYQWEVQSPEFGLVELQNCCGISGATSSNLVVTNVDLTLAGTYRVRVSSAAGSTVSAGATLTVFPIVPLDEALDTPGLMWTTNGNPPWIGHGAVNHDGADAARSGAIGHSASTSMRTILSGPGTVSFWWKVSSQTNNDYLTFNTNGVRATRISGEVNWQFVSVDLGSGNQTLDWIYSKNGSTTNGQDRGWVDQVSFGLLPPTIIAPPANTIVEAGSNATFTVVAAATPPIYYRWLFNGTPLFDGSGISGAATATLTIENAQVSRVGSYSIAVSNSVGTITSATASLALSANVSLAQAFDGPGLTFTTGGTGQPWKGQTAESHDGIDAGQSGVVNDSTYSWVKTSVVGPSPISFWWKVSSEQDHDYLKFMVDGVEQIKISGETDWQQIVYNVPLGTHEIQWRYSKNSSLADGLDRGWVDQIYFGTNEPLPQVTLEPPRVLIQPVSKSVDVGETVELSVAVTGSMPMNYRWLCNGTNVVLDSSSIGGATTAELTLYNVLASQGGNYSVIISNAAGVISSGTAGLTVLPTVDLAEAVDAQELFLTTIGDVAWIGHTAVTHDGTDAGRTGLISAGQSSTMDTMLNGPGTISFWWKVSSETNADTLTFSVNGVERQSISGEVDWHVVSINLPQGLQHLEWTYLKDGAITLGADRGWVDQMSFVPTNPPPPIINAPIAVTAVQLSVSSNLVSLTWEASAAKTYKVFYKDDLAETEWTLLDGEVLIAWKVVDGAIVPDVVIATAQDVLGGPTRFYKVLEY